MTFRAKHRYYGPGVPKISSVLHPDWVDQTEWLKWRLAYECNTDFVNQYLFKMSLREDDDNLAIRKQRSPRPRFAGGAVDEIKNSIYQRMVDIVRLDGASTYREACEGKLGGVDYDGSDMNTFIGTEVLKELLIMKTVGVMTDAPTYDGETLADKGSKHPFFCIYPRESIKSYAEEIVDNVKILKSVLLQEEVDVIDPITQCLSGRCLRHRLIVKTTEGIRVTFYDDKDNEGQSILLDPSIKQIPFHIFKIDKSLMEIIADHQIALLNMESADIAFALGANFPFYFEFYDKNSEQIFSKPLAATGESGAASVQGVSKSHEKAVGSTVGRRFPEGVEKPGFINPSPETLVVSMKKQEQLKNDIRHLVNLNLQEATAKMQSAESKQEENRSLDSSLSAIGLILQKGENELGKFWTWFEGESKAPTVKYPQNYSLKSEEDRQEEAKNLEDRMSKLPSSTYKKVVGKAVATIMVGHKVTKETLEKIHSEIDQSETLTNDPDQILAAQEAGLVDDITASNALGFDGEKVIPLAKKDRAERVALLLEQQMKAADHKASLAGDGAARGAPELGGTTSKEEKKGKDVRGAQQSVKPPAEPSSSKD